MTNRHLCVCASLLALTFGLSGCGDQVVEPTEPARAPVVAPPAPVVAPPAPIASKPAPPMSLPTMGDLSAPIDTVAVPAGEYLTWGKEPIEPTSSARSTLCLNGLWQFVPNADPDKLAQPTGGWG